MKLQQLMSYTRRAIDDYNMIQDGDRIAIGISGGKEKAMDKPHIAQECPKAIEKSSRLRYRFTP